MAQIRKSNAKALNGIRVEAAAAAAATSTAYPIFN